MRDVTVPDADVASVPGRRALEVGLVAVVTLVAFESLAVTTILPEVEARPRAASPGTAG